MDKFQAAFEILYMLASADGTFSKSEASVIVDFLSQNERNIHFDVETVIDSINSLTAKGLVDEFIFAAEVVNETSSATDKNLLLDFAFDLIAADGELSEIEKDLFVILARIWSVDIKKFIEARS